MAQSILENVKKNAGLLGSALQNIRSGLGSGKASTPYGNVDKSRVSQTYANAGRTAPVDTEKLYGKQTVGVQAKSPSDGVKPAANTLPSGQIKGIGPVSSGGLYGNLISNASGGSTQPQVASFGTNTPSVSTNPNQAKVDEINRQIAEKQAQISSAQKQGLKDFDINTSGQVVPQQNPTTQTTGGSNTTAQSPTFGGIIGTLVQNASQPSPVFTNAMNQYNDVNQQLAQSRMNQANALAANAGNPIPLEFQQGRGQIITNQGLAQQGALASQLQGASNVLGAANTQQQTQQAGLTSAAGLVSPVQLPYSNQYVNPLTGQSIGGGTVTGSLQDAVARAVQMINSGSSYNDAAATLSGYGQGGINALTQALPPGFDITQANARAQAGVASTLQTGTTGGQMQKSAVAANQALDTLQQAYNNLGSFSGGSNIPFINQFTQNIAMQTGVGREAVSAYQGALKEARAQINTVLAPLVGVESANATSNSLLPDNMTPQEIPQKIGAAKEYIQQRVAAFSQVSPPGTSSSGGGGFAEDWTQ